MSRYSAKQDLFRLKDNADGYFFWYQLFILLFTFMSYTAYHMSRKPLSVVKSILHQDCRTLATKQQLTLTDANLTYCSWKPFDSDNYSELIGSLEYAYLFTYAIGMLISGHLAERMNLQYYMGFGMIFSGLTTALFGIGYYCNLHNMSYYLAIQVAGGLVQATGWPSVVACVGNWFGKGRRGFIMGVWNSHTSVGNILGSIVAGLFVNYSWGLSFIVPGITIIVLGVFCILLLIPHPSEIGLKSPNERTFVISDSQVTQSPLNNDQQNSIITKHQQLSIDSSKSLESQQSCVQLNEKAAIGFIDALRIPGVIEYSLCLFFAKLVSYTFLYWLPNYIKHSNGLDPSKSAFLSTVFDVGGILGGIMAGVLSDLAGDRAATCSVMLLFAAPMMFVYERCGGDSLANSIVLLFITGGLVNGPYALITTAVSADLGTSSAIAGSSKALATVTAIIDGTGSMGAALGPLLTGIIVQTGWHRVFYMLIGADLAALCISGLVYVRSKFGREFVLIHCIRLIFNNLQSYSLRLMLMLFMLSAIMLLTLSYL